MQAPPSVRQRAAAAEAVLRTGPAQPSGQSAAAPEAGLRPWSFCIPHVPILCRRDTRGGRGAVRWPRKGGQAERTTMGGGAGHILATGGTGRGQLGAIHGGNLLAGSATGHPPRPARPAVRAGYRGRGKTCACSTRMIMGLQPERLIDTPVVSERDGLCDRMADMGLLKIISTGWAACRQRADRCDGLASMRPMRRCHRQGHQEPGCRKGGAIAKAHPLRAVHPACLWPGSAGCIRPAALVDRMQRGHCAWRRR